MADIFLSYKREERPEAEEVVAALISAGFSVWWDENLTPRTSWDAEIEREIADAKAVLVLWSPAATDQNSFVRNEAGYALDHMKLVPAFLKWCELPLRDIQTADLSKWDRRDSEHAQWRKALQWISTLTEHNASPSTERSDQDDLVDSPLLSVRARDRNVVMLTLEKGFTEACVARWLKEVGDRCSKDEVVVELETHKASVEVSAPADGWLTSINAREGQMVPDGFELGAFDPDDS